MRMMAANLAGRFSRWEPLANRKLNNFKRLGRVRLAPDIGTAFASLTTGTESTLPKFPAKEKQK
jgi:hypothetical protein